jgi:hypothetical protein
MDRREVLKLGGAAALALLSPTAIKAAPSASPHAASTIVLADPRYTDSLIFAWSLKRQGARIVTLASDIGGTWFNFLAPQRSRGLHALAGLTLESDLFILERFAEGSSARTCYVGAHDWRCRSGAMHTLSGTIDLDGIAAALGRGKEDWAGGLAEALLMAKDESRDGQRRELECAVPSGSGPRFFVSWLMRWTA